MYRTIISIVILGLLLFVLIPQTDALWRGFDIIKQAAPVPVIIAFFMTGMTYVLATELYHLLAKHPVPLRSIALVQVATALTGRVVPIGIGAMSLNAFFLRKQKHSLSEALAVVATNNGLGVIGHLILLSVIATTAPLPTENSVPVSTAAVYWVLVGISTAIIVAVLSRKLRNAAKRAIKSLFEAVASYRHRPRTIWTALGISMVLSLVYVTILMASGQALGLDLPFTHYFMIYSFSMLTGASTPTPGGLVGVEVGLVGGLVAYGSAADTALAVALLYRLITYWLPLVPGFIAFRLVQRKYF
jgi:uncharacterized protein (TIRG00374 family)